MTATTTVLPSPASLTRSASATLGEMLLDSAARFDGVALEHRDQGRLVTVSYPELGAAVTEIARGLIAVGIQAGDRVCILSGTSPDWTLADYGTLCAGAVVAPIYHTNSPEECAYVLAHSGARLVFCQDEAQAAKIAEVRERCPALEHVVLFRGSAPGAITLAGLRRDGAHVPEAEMRDRLAQTRGDDLATIVYTSGTTGGPKGCMLTHDSLLATAQMYADELALDATHALYQFLPLAHVLARVAQAVVIQVGARASFWSEDPTRIVDELSELAPTHLPAVPRIYEKIHGTVLGRTADAPRLQRVLFRWALARGLKARGALRDGRRPSVGQRLLYRIADRLVLSKVRAVFGPRLQLGLVGAAPVSRELLEFFDACGVLVLEGYGLSETCAAATLNVPGAVRLGSVGRPLLDTEVALADDDEVLLRGPNVFQGYYHDPDATEAALTSDGWLRTGDLGRVDDDGFLWITGRKKDLIITSNGKNVTPVNIESALRQTRYIREAVVFGDNRPYLVALLMLDPDEAAKLAGRLGVQGDAAALAQHPEVAAAIQREVDQVNASLARIEQIKRFAVLDHDLSQNGGELTPTLKVKRSLVYARYAEIFDALYNDGDRR
ncbi:MAG TPA: long-chain fatty acid--CoA ligase [Solirubrobacteraceae bacterium]|nr:long-chain fatty acid--CoA ligase [Solirubrobacteraceae bacterium]